MLKQQHSVNLCFQWGFSMKFKLRTTRSLTHLQQCALGHQKSWLGTQPWLWSRSVKRMEEGHICACSGWAEMSHVGLGSRIKCLCLCEEECSNNLKLQSWTVPTGRCSLVLVLQQFVSKRVTWRWKRHHSVHKLSTFRASVCAEWNQVKQPSQLQYNLKQF